MLMRFDPFRELDRMTQQVWGGNERPQGMFRRQLFLGEGLDSEGLSASYEQGVLMVTLPVAEQAKPRKVEISGSTSGAASIDATSSEGADDDQELTHST